MNEDVLQHLLNKSDPQNWAEIGQKGAVAWRCPIRTSDAVFANSMSTRSRNVP